jgi:hypothetical protein
MFLKFRLPAFRKISCQSCCKATRVFKSGRLKYQTIRKGRRVRGEVMVRRIDTNWKRCALGKLKNVCFSVHGDENIT